MTKTKRFSRIITFALAMLMVVAMAVPAFAAEPRASSPIGQSDKILKGYGSASSYGCLNIVGSGGAYSGQPVNLWEPTGSDDQRWDIVGLGINSNAFIYQKQKTSTGVRLAINAWLVPVAPNVYPVKLAPTINNEADTRLYIGVWSDNKFQASLVGGQAISCKLYIDKSNTSTSRSDVYFTPASNVSNTFWYSL